MKIRKVLNNSHVEPQQVENTSCTNNEEDKHKKHLKQLEKRQAPDILLDCQKAVENKTFLISNSKNQELFEYWFQSRKLCGAD